MKEYYRIGETASLMGITTQTLRFYDKIGLVKPVKIDPRTGYRYYAYEQFHFIDRIKYLQSLGMPLDDIKEVMLSKKVERLLPFLDQQKKVLEEEEKKIRHQIEMVDWYKDYFTYMERNEDAPCVMHLKERYYLQVPCYKRDLLADMEIRLAKEKSAQGIDNAMYLRQYGYKISYSKFCEQKFRPDYYFIYLNEKVKGFKNIYKLPEGEYLCFREKILEENWNPQRIINYFQGKEEPKLMLAMEYEDNLDNYAHANYEVQILLKKSQKNLDLIVRIRFNIKHTKIIGKGYRTQDSVSFFVS